MRSNVSNREESPMHLYRIANIVGPLTRIRAALLFALLAVATFRPDGQPRAQEDAAQATNGPKPDTSMSFLPKAYPRPASAWQSAEKTYYENLLSKGRFDVLVVPFQVQEFGFSRSTRSLMTAELALAIGAAQRKVPNPYLVARALGDGYRRVNPDDVYRLARKLHVGKIVWGYVGYTRTDAVRQVMRITLQHQTFSEDPKLGPGTLETRQFEDLRFFPEDPPVVIYERLLPELLKATGFASPALASPALQSRLDTATIPSSPRGLASESAQPARDAYAFQLLAVLTPGEAERTRERFTEKSMLAVLGMSPASPDYRVLKARALMQMGERAAALKTLGRPDSDEAKHLFALLNGDLPEVQRYATRVSPGVRSFIARVELNDIAAAYGARTQRESIVEAEKLKLPGRSWPFLAKRAFVDWDSWAPRENALLKELLDRDFPIPSFTVEQIARGAAALDDVSRIQTAFDLSILDHVRKFTEARASDWCCAPLAPRVSESDYLDLIEGTGNSNLVGRAAFLENMQGSPQAVLDFLARIDSVYRDHPQLTTVRAEAEEALSRQAEGSSKSGLRKSGYEHAFNAYYWEQGQSYYSAVARSLIFQIDLADYGYLDNPYASDLPFQSFFPSFQGNRADLTRRNALAAMMNSTFDFKPVSTLSRQLAAEQDWAKLDELLKSMEGRFAGNPQRTALLAQNSARKGDFVSAKRYYRESIKSQPRDWDSYMGLGQILFNEGEVAGPAKLFMSYPGFRKDIRENPVELSNKAYLAGSAFYWAGYLAQAMPLYGIAAKLQTGSDASLSSEIRINLLKGDYPAALVQSLQRAQRYNSYYAYRDYLGMLHAMGRNDEAWDAFTTLIARAPNSVLWEIALVGHRKTGASESEIAHWAAREPMSKSSYLGTYLVRAGVTDRTPNSDLPAMIAAVERPVWKFDDKHALVVRESTTPKNYDVLNDPTGSLISVYVFDNYKKSAVKSDVVYFAEAYRLLRRGEYSRAKAILEEALTLYDPRRVDVGYLLPYYAFAAAKSGDTREVRDRLERFELRYRLFDYYLAHAIIAGFERKIPDSLRELKLALPRRPITELRPVSSEYQFAEICEWLYLATRNPKYRDTAVGWAKSVQGFNPWFAWPYAMEARLTNNPGDRERAVAMAAYLDPKSERLAKIPKAEIDAATKSFAGRNLFLRKRSALNERAT